MHQYKKIIARLVAGEFDKIYGDIATAVSPLSNEIYKLIKNETPPRGDFSLPCFALAAKLKQNPAQIAKQAQKTLAGDKHFVDVESSGPFVNISINPLHLARAVIKEALLKKDKFGFGDAGNGKTVVIDFSSPNIAKPLGFHHLRSTMIGNSLYLIHKALGYKTYGINYLGDWGKTFGVLAEIYKRKGREEELESRGIAYLMELYIEAGKAGKEDKKIDAAARAMFVNQEKGEEEALKLWRKFRKISIAEFEKIYSRLGVTFDFFEGESHYRDGMDEIIDMVGNTAGTKTDAGALIVDMEYKEGEPPMMLKKSDGATLYAARDIAAAVDRWNRFKFEKSLYVVGSEQRQYFSRLCRALKSMKFDWSDNITHVQFGRIKGMSTRKGTVVFLEDVLDEAQDRALTKMKKSSSNRELNLDEVSKEVGTGGIVFGDLKNLRTTDYSFNWEEMFNAKGFTGICVQYAHARCCSILKKAGSTPQKDYDTNLLNSPYEIALLKDLERIKESVISAASELEPSKIARAAYNLARSWNRFQQAGNEDRNLRILCEDDETKKARLAMVDAVKWGLKNSLRLLGVKAPQAM